MSRPRVTITKETAIRIVTNSALGFSDRSIAKDEHLDPKTVKRIRERTESSQDVVLKRAIDKINLRLPYKLITIAEKCINGIDDEKIRKASLSQLAIAAGILIDKSRLIGGESTQNIYGPELVAYVNHLKEQQTLLEIQMQALDAIEAQPQAGRGEVQ